MSSTGKTGKHATLYLRLAAIAVAALFVPAFILTGCLPDGGRGGVSTEIVEAKIGDQVYYIPKAYLNFQHTSVGPDGFLLQAFYPGSAIVPGDVNELWKQDEWWKNVRILASKRHSPISFDEFAQSSTAYLKASEIVGNEYGLIHQKQPEGVAQDQLDIWFEKKDQQIVSYVTCSEHLIENDFPQCSHDLFIGSKLWLKVTYDKRLLPKWKTVQNDVEEMLDSFQSPGTAREFLYHQSISSQETSWSRQ